MKKKLNLFNHFVTSILCLLLFSSLVQVPNTANASTKTLRLATTTSTENSGLLSYLFPHFENDTGYNVHVIAVGTGKAIRMGRDGDVDVILVHALDAEKEFVEKGFGVKRYPVMYNDFILIGTSNDPASIKNSTSIQDAFKKIDNNKSLFISRGDDSGTHKKEKNLWASANIQPEGSWYREIGQGMGKAIQIANELGAYTLTDRGTWLSYKDKTNLEIVYQGHTLLFNPYGIIAVNPERYPDINIEGANALIKWLTSKKGQTLIGQFKIEDQVLFTPSAE